MNAVEKAMAEFDKLPREAKVAIINENAMLTQEVLSELNCSRQFLWGEEQKGNIKSVKKKPHGKLFLREDVANYKAHKAERGRRT